MRSFHSADVFDLLLCACCSAARSKACSVSSVPMEDEEALSATSAIGCLSFINADIVDCIWRYVLNKSVKRVNKVNKQSLVVDEVKEDYMNTLKGKAVSEVLTFEQSLISKR